MDLVKLALAVGRSVQEHPPITADPSRCLRANDKSATCTLCADLCPVDAIQLTDGLAVNADACVRCGLCLHRCPTGALDGADGVYRLLYCASQLVDRENLEIACAHHPDPAVGEAKPDAVITTNTCLAALGASAYLALIAQDVRRLTVRLDACDQCPLACNKPEIETAIQQAQTILSTLDNRARIEPVTAVKRSSRRSVLSVMNPPVSRRSFFQSLTHQPAKGIDPLFSADTPQLESIESAPRERRRLISVLRELATNPPDTPLTIDGFAQFSVSEACTACDLCVRVCPSGALQLNQDDVSFALTFSPADCTDCGLCLKFCAADALHRTGTPSLAALIASEPQTLRTGRLVRCKKCASLFAASSEAQLCPACAFRKNNPFGSANISRTGLKNPRTG
ncbi:MAG: 4Fe-4S binding protein [Anaerolineae bacterium]|nr:4Fe-4S binding protein [Anaerolineae bacterium]